ncbi:DNA/RNA helicase domain-containing protein [Oenococcus oeni]
MSNKYLTLELSLDKQGEITNKPASSSRNNAILNFGDVIYIYEGPKEVYIGQTKHFYTRHQEHFDHDLSFIVGAYKRVIVLFGKLVNQLSLDDIEKQLITYITIDIEKGKKSIEIDNATAGNNSPEYDYQSDVQSDLLVPFWQELYEKGFVQNKDLSEVKKTLLFKYPPFHQLSKEQLRVIETIISSDQLSEENFLIDGLAGTGKTVVLTNLAARLAQLYPEKKIAVIVKSNWTKAGKNIFDAYGLKNIQVTTSLKFIRNKKSVDYALIDEAHRLRRYYSKGNHVTQDIFKDKKGNYDPKKNELGLISKNAKSLVLFYDSSQSIRPSDIPASVFQAFLRDRNFKKLDLKHEYRISIHEDQNHQFTGNDYLNGVRSFLQLDTRPFNKALFSSYKTNSDAYFGVADSISDLFDYLNQMENYQNNTIDRILAGYTRPWLSKKNKTTFDWIEGNRHWKWNSTNEGWITKITSRNEIGSVHAIQGVDLNYAGVIISTDLRLINGKLVASIDDYKDTNGKFKKEDYDPDKFTFFIKNIYYVLLSRAMNGVRVYFEDPKLKEYFENWIKN